MTAREHAVVGQAYDFHAAVAVEASDGSAAAFKFTCLEKLVLDSRRELGLASSLV